MSIRNLQLLVVMLEPFIHATTLAKEGEVVPAKATPRQQDVAALRSAKKLAERLQE